jgi:hypothetical protein
MNAGLAWWSETLETFRTCASDAIFQRLVVRAADAYRTNEETQQRAWIEQIGILKVVTAAFPANWRLVLEFPVVRIGIRIDAVLLTDRAIFVFEFKTLDSAFDSQARLQAEDYALDLRDFHSGSKDQIIIPVVVAKKGTPARPQWAFPYPGVSQVYDARPDELSGLIDTVLSKIFDRHVDIEAWEGAPYRPIPTIIEAARRLYQKHGVEDIKSYRSDTENLTNTTAAVLQAIADAKAGQKFIIVFVTGTPGAGKTLCGLNAVFSEESDATFLTGTLPMVYVLKKALALDAVEKFGRSVRQAARETKSKIQSITGFIKYYETQRPKELPEHVIVFDEAQRAWDAKMGAKSSFKLKDSEAAVVLDIMARHQDYAVVVALVGNAQEINTGEGGLAEWGLSLMQRPQWEIRAAPGVVDPNNEPRQRLFNNPTEGLKIDHALHLQTGLRNLTPRASQWVDAVLRGQVDEARRYAIDGTPFFVTRSLAAMRAGLRARARGLRRLGLVCSSGAKRLVADGIWPDFEHLNESKVANWFLARWPDVRASDALEIPVTEFAAQGLELDYVGLCWGGDLTWSGKWNVRNFSGNDWNQTRKADAIDYRINAYRVLLTRARAETIIWVPAGSAADKTRDPLRFDATVKFLLACGAQELEPVPVPENLAAPELFE